MRIMLTRILTFGIALVFGVMLISDHRAAAQAPPVQNPQQGAIGVEGKIPSAPPSQGATITTPVNGQTFTNLPITVAGLCPNGLLVKIFANNVFVGAVQCGNGSYSIQVDLFAGRNDLVARVFDSLDQAGPDSNIVSVTFNDTQFGGSPLSSLSLTSIYAVRGADPGESFTWPMAISGGTPPYAVSVDWGDGKKPDLISLNGAGTFETRHAYENAGVYVVIVRGTDKNGQTAFLQLVGIANGAVVQSTKKGSGATVVEVRILWIPALFVLPLLFVAFWLGRRYELSALRKHLDDLRSGS